MVPVQHLKKARARRSAASVALDADRRGFIDPPVAGKALPLWSTKGVAAVEKLKLIVTAVRDRLMLSRNNRYVGDFASWEDACRCCRQGYGDDVILDKVSAATREVVAGRAGFERDSVLFYHAEYNWPLLTALWRLRAQYHNGIGVLDFGGALGSTYWQNRKMFEGIGRLRWSVVEQPKTVACGQKEFQNEQLVFYESVDECFTREKIDLVFLGSVLNYVPDVQELM